MRRHSLWWLVMVVSCGRESSKSQPVQPPAAGSDATVADAAVAIADSATAQEAYKNFRMPSPPEPSSFAYDPTANASGTGRGAEIVLSPRVLVALLGAPYVDDPTKVSGSYTFKGANGVFTVYEWESTQNSSEGCGPMPAVFWATDRPYRFHVGSPEGASEDETGKFVAWLRAQVSTMLRKMHAKNIATLDKLIKQLGDGSLSSSKVTAAANALQRSWKLGPVAAKAVTQPLTRGKRKLEKFEDWNRGGGNACDPFEKDSDEEKPPTVDVGREDPRSIWREVLRALVEDPKQEDAAALQALLAAKPGEEWNAWEEYSPTR